MTMSLASLKVVRDTFKPIADATVKDYSVKLRQMPEDGIRTELMTRHKACMRHPVDIMEATENDMMLNCVIQEIMRRKQTEVR